MTRLDAALAQRGLAQSRTRAAELIAQGLVTVNNKPVVKASYSVGDDDELHVAGADHYVSRAAHKLIAGLDAFSIEAAGTLALDMGASTGGFTQVLRERQARRVLAVDVGHGQLHPTIAADPGVIAVEGFNVRHMTPHTLAAATGINEAPQLLVADLSFISLELILPAAAGVAASGSNAVFLIKPQFEVGRTAVRGGLVTDPHARIDAIERVLWNAYDVGWGTRGLAQSPLPGTHGNVEYLVHFVPGAHENPSQWMSTIEELAGGR